MLLKSSLVIEHHSCGWPTIIAAKNQAMKFKYENGLEYFTISHLEDGQFIIDYDSRPVI